MMASPSIALALSLKALAAEDAQGKVWLSYNALEYLKQRHGLRNELLNNISASLPKYRGCTSVDIRKSSGNCAFELRGWGSCGARRSGKHPLTRAITMTSNAYS